MEVQLDNVYKHTYSFMSMRKFHPSQRKEMARIPHAPWMVCVLQLCWKNSMFGGS